MAFADESGGEVPLAAVEKEGSIFTDPETAAELPRSNLGRAEVVELLSGVFEPVLQGAAGPFDDLSPDWLIGEHAAVISSEAKPDPAVEIGAEETQVSEDSRVLFESSLPVSQEGEVVDLSLERTDTSLEPVNPITEVDIPAQLGNGIALPEARTSVEMVNAPVDRAPSTIDSVAVYPNVATDTDLLVAPVPLGVEMMTTLRSPEAPTSQSFRFDLGQGNELRRSAEGGAKVVSEDGEVVLLVHAPTAIDAAGNPVPARMDLVGDTLTVKTEPSEETQYPVLVDPLVESFSQGGTESNNWGWPGWEYTTNHNLLHAWIEGRSTAEAPGGLSVWANGTGSGVYSPGNNVHWYHAVPRYREGVAEGTPPTSFITGFTLNGIYTHGSTGTSSPYMYAGIWDPPLNRWAGTGQYAVWGREGNLPNIVGGSITFTAGGDKQAQIAQGPGFDVNENATMNGEREMSVASASIEVGDDEPPQATLGSASSVWANQTSQVPIAATIKDTGLGAKAAEFSLPGQGAVKVTNSCTGTASSPCPSQWRATLAASQYNASLMPQGWLSIPINGQDVLGNKSTAPALAEVGIDHTNPSLSALSGTATEQASLGTHKLEYGLKFSATDGFESPVSLQKTLTAELGHPFGVAVDNSGTIWVVDKDHNQIKKFSQSGAYLGAVGKKGSGNGELLEPRMIAIDAAGNAWVTDLGNHRLEEFSSSGAYIRQFKDASLESPYGITIAPNGSIWVSNVYANEVVQLTEAAGTLSITRRVKGETKVPKGLPLEGKDTTFYSPGGLASDASGNIWVADTAHHRLQEVSVAGSIIRQVGNLGTAPGQFNAPYGVAVTGLGHILVADSENNRVQVLDSEGDFLRFVGDGSTQAGSPKGVAVGPGNTAVVSDWTNNRLLKWGNVDLDSQSGVVKSEVLVDGIPREEFKPACSGTAVCSISSHEWTLKAREYAEGKHSLQVVVTDGVGLKAASPEITVDLHPDRTAPQLSLSGSMTEQATLGSTRPTYKLKIQGTDPEPKEGSLVFSSSVNSGNGTSFSSPADVAVDAKGNYWVLDKGNNRLVKFGPTDSFLLRAGSSGSSGGQLAGASGIATDSSNNVWVADTLNNRVEEFNENGAFVAVFGKDVNKTRVEGGGTEAERNLCTAASGNVCKAGVEGSALGQLKAPKGISVTSSGNVWVADTGNNRLQKFSPSGAYLNKLSLLGSEGQLKEPAALAVGPDGSIWAADTGNNRIAEWNSSLTFVRKFGSEGAGSREFRSPAAIEIDAHGNVWVADAGNNRVKKFDGTGQFLIGYGTQQPTGDSNAFSPVGLGLDAQGGIYVADAGNNRVQHWVPSASSQSGVVSSTIKVDGKVVDSYNPGCTAEACTLTREWTLKSDSYSVGSHTVEAMVTDGSGLTSNIKSLTINIQRDTTAPQLSSTGPLAEAPEGWVEQKTYSVTSTATDANGYGVQQIRLLIDGIIVGETAVTSCEVGGCSKGKTFNVNAANYKGGAHEVAVVAEDGAGNWKKQSWTMNVDPEGPISASEATSTLEAMEATVPPEEEFEPVASTEEFQEPQVIEAGYDPHLRSEEGSVVSTGVTVESDLNPTTEALKMEGTEGPLELTPAENLANPQVVEGSAAVLPSTDTSVDTVVRPEYSGAYMFTTIRDASAPEHYIWHVHLNPGQYLQQYDNQDIQVMSKTGAEAWLITATHARDATGQSVASSLSILEGSDIDFTVNHRQSGIVYPVSAGENYMTGYAVVTAILPEEVQTSEEGALLETEMFDDELGPEPDGVEPLAEGSTPTEGQAKQLLHFSNYGNPVAVPAPRPAGEGEYHWAIYRSVCGPTCSKWNAKVYNATYWLKNNNGPNKPLNMTWWEEGTEVHARIDENWRYEWYLFETMWNCGAIGPKLITTGSGEHLTAYGHFTVEDWYGSNGLKPRYEKNFTLFAWVFPNGVQQRRINENWSGQPSDRICPRVAS